MYLITKFLFTAGPSNVKFPTTSLAAIFNAFYVLSEKKIGYFWLTQQPNIYNNHHSMKKNILCNLPATMLLCCCLLDATTHNRHYYYHHGTIIYHCCRRPEMFAGHITHETPFTYIHSTYFLTPPRDEKG